ncbi:MAG: lysostaphin resistance A-like protein [Labrys sp. (in: a-proteobacteria)]
MNYPAVAEVPVWLRIIRFPLVRILVLGGGLLYLMSYTEEVMIPYKDTPLTAVGIALAFCLLGMAIYVAYGRFVEGREVTELSTPGMAREWVIGALLGAGLYTACVLVLMAMGIFTIQGLNPWAFLIPAIGMALKSGVFEELVFRGVLFKSTEDMLGSWAAIIISSAVFGFLHLVNPDATIGGAIFITIEAGLLLAAAYLATRRLWLCIGFHMSWNYVQSAVFSGIVSGGVAEPGLLQKTIVGSDLMTGGSFGMERSILALLFDTTAGLVLLWIAYRRGHIRPFSLSKNS